MTMTDPIADMLTRIRNATIARHDSVRMPSSKLKEALADVLQREGYIADHTVTGDPGRPGRTLEINLKFTEERQPIISGLRRVSKPGLRVYIKADRLPRVLVVSASPSFPRARGSSPTARRASAGWAARSSATSGRGFPCPASAACRSPFPPASRCPSAAARSPSRARRAPWRDASADIVVRQEDSTLLVERPDDEREHRALHGLTRSLVNNMVTGVTDGFAKELEIVGVGYRATAQGPNRIELAVGYSHTVPVDAPDGISFEVPQPTRIIVRGIDKQAVGQVAADIRKIRKPEPYKGKGIRYVGEVVRRKAGKAAK